ncbi:purine nucleoside phosphorylase [Iodidimonas gelatinilytica]|uniref:Purine nucleoside phosphorylase n=1 Tax=Iodidimonas gelatinilytica TaxID=1236966 RepID=A0A5A7ML07_9PROT|nr:purine-nucleoside phosphorylase [Iodidimonas gelatinilytica]GEQ96587.1 purine nucleoside phosphorylase [Iodidimonas gelatinilytica]GER00094.1 purine nucleoside phosphorylase [Iodidimonas gelatinilytica]
MTDYDIDACVRAIRERHSGPFPKSALILGSGLGRFGETMQMDSVIPYGDIPGFPVSTVAGHSGKLLIGSINGAPLVCMQGRMHLYEGYPAHRLAIPIRTLKALGVEQIVITNAAGSTHLDMGPGSLMMIEDHINFSGQNPLIGPNDDRFGDRFFDMSDAWNADLRGQLQAAAKAEDVTLHSGVYLQVAGPNFETPAEVRMFAQWGADAIGMSTVPECLVAHHAGMKVAGISVVTNLAAGIAKHALSHDETITEANKAFENMQRLLARFFADGHKAA